MSLTVSVVTICKQNRDELAATLDSILGQEPPVDSCVVIDGGSTDGTVELLRTYHGKFGERLDWVSEADGGISDAFNKGLKRARGEAILFLNAGDIFIDKTYCARAAGLLAASPATAFVHADILFVDGLAGEIRLAARPGQNLGRGMPYRHQTMLVRSEVFRRIGGFGRGFRIGMDYDLVCRMHAAGMTGIHDAMRPVVRMDGGGSRSSGNARDARSGPQPQGGRTLVSAGPVRVCTPLVGLGDPDRPATVRVDTAPRLAQEAEAREGCMKQGFSLIVPTWGRSEAVLARLFDSLARLAPAERRFIVEVVLADKIPRPSITESCCRGRPRRFCAPVPGWQFGQRSNRRQEPAKSASALRRSGPFGDTVKFGRQSVVGSLVAFSGR